MLIVDETAAVPTSLDERVRADPELCDWTVDPYQVLGTAKAEEILWMQGLSIQPRTMLQLRATMQARSVAELRTRVAGLRGGAT
jgi:hypothetical protein